MDKFIEKKYSITNQWLKASLKGIDVIEYLSKQYGGVILYGVTELSQRFIEAYCNGIYTIELIGISDRIITERYEVAGENKSILCIPVNEIKNYYKNDVVVIISTVSQYENIEKCLRDEGVENIETIENIVYRMK